MKTRTNFTHRVDMWDCTGQNIIEHLAGVEDYEVALATYRRLPTLARHPHHPAAGARVIEDSRRLRVVS
jgi:hypothetical protein